MEHKNRGFILPKIVINKDYVLGSYGSLGGEELQPDGQWLAYLPQGEKQLNFGFDPQACASFGTLNAVEILLRRLYGDIDNFSDRFLAKISGTTTEGNDPQTVAEALRHNGVPREDKWPITSDLTSWTKFYADLDRTVQTLALEFVAKLGMKHEYVATTPTQLKEALQYSPLGISVSAWQKAKNGLYVSSFPNNHWAVLVGYKDGEYWLVYDSYDENDDYLKKLAWDYDFAIAKRYKITQQADTESSSWISFIVNLIRVAFGLTLPAEPTAPTVPTPPPAPAPEKPPHLSKISAWALAIQHQEGGKPNDINTRLKNPGNLKYTSYTASLGGKKSKVPGLDGGTFCEFPTYQAGFKALCAFLTDAANDKLRAYHNARSLKAFTMLYANIPSSHQYPERVAKDLGVPVNIDIKELL